MGTPAPPKRRLFLCRHNHMRTPTAERMFGKRSDLDVRSMRSTRVNDPMLEWADLIVIMDDQQRSLRRWFAGPPTLAHLIRLEIPDEFTFMRRNGWTLTVRVTPHRPLLAKAGARRHAACQTTADLPYREP
jgi:predicted protein tyrosine phosphatase